MYLSVCVYIFLNAVIRCLCKQYKYCNLFSCQIMQGHVTDVLLHQPLSSLSDGAGMSPIAVLHAHHVSSLFASSLLMFVFFLPPDKLIG